MGELFEGSGAAAADLVDFSLSDEMASVQSALGLTVAV